jgi:nicotinamide riboside kinase
MPNVINIFGGPGVGKTTLASEIFVILKKMGFECANIGEYAKDKTREKNLIALSNQIYIFAKQQYRMYLVAKEADYLICDSPLLLSAIYGKVKKKDPFYKLILQEFNKYDNLNIFINRSDNIEYNPVGRNQSYEEALKVDAKVKKFLDKENIKYITYNIDDEFDDQLYEKILKNYGAT